MNTTFDMVAKTFQGLEEVMAGELRALGADEVTPGKRMVAFKGNLETLYRANFCCRTALRILKPFYSFDASDADSLYAGAKLFDWSSIMNVNQTFAIDTVVFSDEFRNSQYVTYRIKSPCRPTRRASRSTNAAGAWPRPKPPSTRYLPPA